MGKCLSVDLANFWICFDHSEQISQWAELDIMSYFRVLKDPTCKNISFSTRYIRDRQMCMHACVRVCVLRDRRNISGTTSS